MYLRNIGIFFAILFLISFESFAQDACAETCVIHADCGTGAHCDRGICKYRNYFCGNERWSVNDRGETDCTNGYVFEGTYRCVPSIQCDPTTAHCQDLLSRWKRARSNYESANPEPHPNPLTCVSCEDDEGCSSDKMCWSNRCVERRPQCVESSQGEQFKVNNRGQFSSCGLYACEKVRGECFSSCQKPSDCRKGSNCLRGRCH